MVDSITGDIAHLHLEYQRDLFVVVDTGLDVEPDTDVLVLKRGDGDNVAADGRAGVERRHRNGHLVTDVDKGFFAITDPHLRAGQQLGLGAGLQEVIGDGGYGHQPAGLIDELEIGDPKATRAFDLEVGIQELRDAVLTQLHTELLQRAGADL
jgi:hypothetical protein